MKKMHQTHGFQEHKIRGKNSFSFFLYVTMVVTEVGSMVSIETQEKHQENITLLFLWS
jgi:hypothetical protein